MIIKSMSRKTPSFEQLVQYMDSEKSDSYYDLYYNCYSRNQSNLIAEFNTNSLSLNKRKGGNYLYHEIVSISRKGVLSPTQEKEALRVIVNDYVQRRCPNNMVYGCLHEDHEHHLHYHLVISANEHGEAKRHFLTKRDFANIKKSSEQWARQHHPELQQEAVIDVNSHNEKMILTPKEGIQTPTLSKIPTKEEVKLVVQNTIQQSQTQQDFEKFLAYQGYGFYIRGKNFGVVVTDGATEKKYRFSTLKVHEEYLEFLENIRLVQETQKEKKAPKVKTEKEVKPDENVDTFKTSTEEPSTKTVNIEAENIVQKKEKKPEIIQPSKIIEDEVFVAEEIKADVVVEEENHVEEKQKPSDKKQEKQKRKFLKSLREKIARPKKKKTETKEEEPVKMKDIFGLRDSFKEQKKSKSVSREEVQADVAREVKQATEKIHNQNQETQRQNSKRTVEEVRQELERMSEKKKQSSSNKSKHSQ